MDRYLNASEAAKHLGVSIKALRLYESRGLLTPLRTTAGWRAYGATEMNRAREIATLRSLGFSLAQVSRIMGGEPSGLDHVLAEHRATLEAQLQLASQRIDQVKALSSALALGEAPSASAFCRLSSAGDAPAATFDLPWPWSGETFDLRQVRAVNYIVGPLFSGKTRLARLIADTLPNTAFVGLERLDNGCAQALAKLGTDAALNLRVEQVLAWLVDDGATPSPALAALLSELVAPSAGCLVVDMIEQGLDAGTQSAVASFLRRRRAEAPTLFVLTRSNAILDLSRVGPDETILHCPANHSSPFYVAPYPRAPGFESVANCLAAPEVRARTAGVVAVMPSAA